MIASTGQQNKAQAPVQPMGWPINSWINVANQARQQAEAQRQRVVQLERRNRRLRSATAGALAISGTVGFVLLALGGLFGYAIGVGLIGLAR